MSNSGEFKLIFEGPADESAETLRKLRASLLADVGLSVAEAQAALQNVPTTLKVSEVEEELKPIYSALKKAGGKVLLVCPENISNEKAYFLDIEQTGLDEDLLKTLENFPAEQEEEVTADESAVELDLTIGLEAVPKELIESEIDVAPNDSESAELSEEDRLANELLKSLTASASASLNEEEAPEPEPQVEPEAELTAVTPGPSVALPEEPAIAQPETEPSVAAVVAEATVVEPAPATDNLPPSLELGAEAATDKSEAISEPPKSQEPAPIDLEAKPLFEVDAPQAESPVTERIEAAPEKEGSKPEPIKAQEPAPIDLESKPLFEVEALEATGAAPKTTETAVEAQKTTQEPPKGKEPAPIDLESKPLFEVEAPKAGESLDVPVPGKIAAPAEPMDLTLDFSDEPVQAKPQEKPAENAPEEKTPATPPAAPTSDDSAFSLDELSQSLDTQIESEISGSKKPEQKEAPAKFNVGSSAEKPVSQEKASIPETRAEVSMAMPQEVPPFSEEPRAEFVEEAPAPVKKSASKSSLGLDLIVPILVGASLLGVANWLYFSQDAEEIVLPQLNFANEKTAVTDDTLRAEASKAFAQVEAVSSEADAALTWTFFHDGGALKTVNVEVLRPPAPELRPEQIVRGERPALWLRKIELSSFVFEKTADGGFKAKGPARIFLEQGPVKRRLVGQAEVIVRSFIAPQNVTAQLIVHRGLSDLPNEEGLLYEALPNGDIRLALVTGVQK